MKKKILFLLTFTGFFIIAGVRLIKSQSLNIESSYILSRDLYHENYRTYLASKKSYSNQPTLERKNILFKSLKNLLYSRNKYLYNYLEFYIDKLETKLDKAEIDKLESWQVWLNKDETEIIQVQDLGEAYLISAELKEIYPEMETDIYFQLAKYAINNQLSVINQIENIILKLQPLTDRYNWVEEVRLKTDRVKELQKQGYTNLEETRVRHPGDIKRSWRSTMKLLNQAQDELDTSLKYIDEVLKTLE